VLEPSNVNDVSATKIRLAIKKGVSVKYLTPDPVINYIEEHGIYQEGKVSSTGTGES
jgi:nicotinamide mononucleotide adenylyltransferase